MYARDPRASWSAPMSHYFPSTAARPDDLRDLTPIQLDHLVRSLEKTLAATEKTR
jgi:hypothetical protein